MMSKELGLVIDLRAGEEISLSGPARITVIHKSGQFARLRVVASPDVKIERKQDGERAAIDTSMAM